MKTELCEPCEWAGDEVPAEHYVGWDQMPLCDMHFELDKQGRLGNWVTENVDFSNEGEAIPAPEVTSGKIKLKPVGGALERAYAQPLIPKDEPLDVLESDAWAYLKGAGEGNFLDLTIATYIVEFLRGYDRDISNLETSLEQVRKL